MVPIALSAAASAFAAALIATDKRITRRLKAANATIASRAVQVPLSTPLVRLRLKRLASVGAVVQTASGYYLDEMRWRAYRSTRRRRAIVILALVLAALLLGAALGFLR